MGINDMENKQCNGCEIGKMSEIGNNLIPKGSKIINMDNGWVVNHSGESIRNYLGHLILQPKKHHMDFDELEDDEAKAFGLNLRRTIASLKGYWAKEFPWDELQRVYVVYFWESAFIEKPPKWHMHVHLFPRTKLMVGGYAPTEVGAWQILELTEKAYFPYEYRIRFDNMKSLFDFLSEDLTS